MAIRREHDRFRLTGKKGMHEGFLAFAPIVRIADQQLEPCLVQPLGESEHRFTEVGIVQRRHQIATNRERRDESPPAARSGT